MLAWLLLALLMVVYCITIPQFLKRAGASNSWLGYIPVVQFIPLFKILKHPFWWIFLMLCPGVNLLMMVIINVEIGIAFGKRTVKEQWLFGALPWYALPQLAFKDGAAYIGPRDWTGIKKSFLREWGEAILFAVVAASVIRTFFIEAFTIPTPSMENSMLVGDYLFVSKVSYGAKIPQTPMSIPFLHNAMPGGMTNSYVEWFSLPYYRLPGLGKVDRYDPVVFNYPHGDTIVVDPFLAGHDYYEILRREAMTYAAQDAKVSPQSMEAYEHFLANQELFLGKARKEFKEQKSCMSCANGIKKHGGTRYRPMDKKENYVKRCIGLPGETIEIKDHVVHINGQAIQDPGGVMYNYLISCNSDDQLKGILRKLEVAPANVAMVASNRAVVPFTYEVAEQAKTMGGLTELRLMNDSLEEENRMQMFPNLPMEPYNHWTVDNFGPLHIPAKGEVIDLTPENIALYKHTIVNYEGNTLELKDGKVYINGQETRRYTFHQDYYWMMGDNRHHSVDSRFWGWVPEDHIVGKPVFTWWSKNQAGHNKSTSVRWDRIFHLVD
jgi:signal peptidase I